MADLTEVRRRWSTLPGGGADAYTDAGCRVLAEHAFRDVPELLAEVDRLRGVCQPFRRGFFAATQVGDADEGFFDLIMVLTPSHRRWTAEQMRDFLAALGPADGGDDHDRGDRHER